MPSFSEDIAMIHGIAAVPRILDVVCRTTGMGFAAVARVTEERWIACSVLDKIDFGLKPGGELKVETTICHEIRQMREPVVIDEVACDPTYCNHHTPRQYGFQSYISMPIILPDGRFFGTLCCIDPRPARVKTPEIIGMFKLFAELISFHIDAAEKLAKSESKLSEQRAIAELREQFIGVLGHDLRTPLGAVAMCSTLLGESDLDEDQSETLRMMKRSVARMSDLIDDAMDFTRGRLGGGILAESKTDDSVQPLIEQVIDDVRSSWPEREIVTQFELTESIQYDRKRLAQLFTNLLSNAMIHGLPDKPVYVRAVSREAKFELSVANAAKPIPPEVMNRLFEPFSRGGSGNYQQGLGLGLYIASEIAKSHGGLLGVTSTPEETRFTFIMPLSGVGSATGIEPAGNVAPHSAPAPVAGEFSASKVRILLIKDHADTLAGLTRLLTRRGHAVTPASSGTLARAASARETFDLIVSDIGLPDCSGFELLTELCSERHTPAIAMSGFGMEDDIVKSKAAGFAEHLTKPVNFEELIRTINRLTRQNA